MNYTEYTKNVPPFFEHLLSKINKIKIFSINENKELSVPSEVVHYQPYKSGIQIYTSLIIKLSHELSHMLEVCDNSRLLQFDYGIHKYFPVTRGGQLKAIAREARARGIQTRLVELAFGNSTLLVHRGAYMYVAPATFPVGRFAKADEVNEWSAHITRTTYESWSKDRILDVWERKANYINEWLETSQLTPQDTEVQLKNYKTNSDRWDSLRQFRTVNLNIDSGARSVML
jgi:hypothetical protein